MTRKRWIKLWTQETLYGTTSIELELDEQALWFKLLAMAGDSIEPGRVEVAPSVPMTDQQIASIMKAPLDVWLRTKQKLLDPNIKKIRINEGIIHITNWDKYQSEYERTKKYRGSIFPTPNATQKSTTKLKVEKTVENVSSIPDQTRPDQRNITTTREQDLAKISRLYEDNIGRLTPAIADRLRDIVEEYPPSWFEEALKEAVNLEHRNLKYIGAILERWKVEGFKAAKQKGAKDERRRVQERRRPIKYIRGSEPVGPEDTEDMP